MQMPSQLTGGLAAKSRERRLDLATLSAVSGSARSRRNDLTPKQALDQLAVAALKCEIEDLIVLDAPYEVTGFTLDEIDHILLDGEQVSGMEAGPLEPEMGQIALARPRDIFCFGAQRVACGGATSANVWEALMEGSPTPARLVLTDEPYNVPIAGYVSGKGSREFAMASGEMSDPEYLGFNEAWMKEVLHYLGDSGGVRHVHRLARLPDR